jgi:hypothetical protein
MLKEIVVFLSQDYKVNESIWISSELTKDEITEEVHKKYKEWYYYDIL